MNKYDFIACRFALARNQSLEKEKKYLDAMIKHLPAHAHILDLGCGTGEPIATYLTKQGFCVTGLDNSKELLKFAQANVSSMQLIEGDMRTIFLDNRYDALIAWDSFFHLPKNDQKEMFPRFRNWLKNQGLLIFTSGDTEGEILDAEMLGEHFSYYSLSSNDYEALLAQYCFSLLIKEEDEPHHLVWLAQLN